MSNRNYQYIDSKLSPDKADNYSLLLLVGDRSFSFAITENNKLLLLAEDVDLSELGGPSGDDDLLFKKYKQRIIGLPNSGFTFMPLSLFDPAKVTDLARFLDVKATEKVFSQPFDADNQVIYKVDEKLVESIEERFHTGDAVFGAAGWIKANAAENPSNHNLYLDIKGNKVEILNFKDGRLRFYNAFTFMNEDELAYFTTMVSGELHLSVDSVTIVLSGDVTAGDTNSSRLAKFFGKVELNELKPVKLPRQFESHSVLSLTALSLCGSSEEL